MGKGGRRREPLVWPIGEPELSLPTHQPHRQQSSGAERDQAGLTMLLVRRRGLVMKETINMPCHVRVCSLQQGL